MRTATPLVRLAFGLALLTATTVPSSTALPDGAPPGVASIADDCLPKYPPPPVLKLKVRVPECAGPGQALEYRICVENCSQAEAHHVVVKDALPGNVKYVSADPLPTKQGDELHWPMGTIGAGAVREIRLIVQPTNKEDVKNCVRVQFEHGQCVVTRQALRPGAMQPPLIGEQPTKPKIEVVPEAKGQGQPMPELDLVVQGAKDQYANLATKYLIRVTNKGKAEAKGVLVSSRPPAKLKVVKVSAPGIIVANEAAWFLGTLAPGAVKVVELTLKANEKGEHCFTTTVQADQGVKLEREFCTRFQGVSAMSIELKDAPDPVFVGERTNYSIVIRNPGSNPLTNVQLRALVPTQLRFETSTVKTDKQSPLKDGLLLEFEPIPIPAGEQVRYVITCSGVSAAYTRFQVSVTADQLEAGRPVFEQESTTVVDERPKVRVEKVQ